MVYSSNQNGLGGLGLAKLNKGISCDQTGEIYLTFDIDWAMDNQLIPIIHELKERKLKSTWFVIHQTRVLDILRESSDLFELVHPNFLPESTHGRTEDEILSHVLDIVPEAVTIRNHAVYQSGPLLSKIKQTTKLELDSSIFLPEMSYIRPVDHLTPFGKIVRFVYILGLDDYELLKSERNRSPQIILIIIIPSVSFSSCSYTSQHRRFLDHYQSIKHGILKEENRFPGIKISL